MISTFLKKISKIFCRFKKSLYFCNQIKHCDEERRSTTENNWEKGE